MSQSISMWRILASVRYVEYMKALKYADVVVLVVDDIDVLIRKNREYIYMYMYMLMTIALKADYG